ncbi:hypothetical protein F2P44_01800 [Massilia sp. CCM 8695]|uniref:Resolvase/invertase-type recombinase catalytic domain-containing protein n=2 Tax=Massilia frigida TaxID=2609281 RepID=A0ABX0MYB1_9BURK|nr:hypothetical protein [Massilia frigida]
MLATSGAVAEMERNLIVERTQAGLARVKAERETLVRRPKTTPAERLAIVAAYEKRQSVSELVRVYGISGSTCSPLSNLPTLRARARSSRVRRTSGLHCRA